MSMISEIKDLQDEVREGYMPEKKPAPDYGEPWKESDFDEVRADNRIKYYRVSPDRLKRAVACVNACAGMNDTSAEIQAMQKAIKDLERERDEAQEQIQMMLKHDAQRLESDSIVGSCDCLTKTPEIRYHKPGCKYRILSERDEARDRLHLLDWTPVTERLSTIEDASEFEDVEWSDGKTIWQNSFYLPNSNQHKATHWRRITLP